MPTPGQYRIAEVSLDGAAGAAISARTANNPTDLAAGTGTSRVNGQLIVDPNGVEVAAGTILSAGMRTRQFKFTDTSTMSSTNATGAAMGARGGTRHVRGAPVGVGDWCGPQGS